MATRSAKPTAGPTHEPGPQTVFTESQLAAELAVGHIRAVYVVTSGDDPNRDKQKSERPHADPQSLLRAAALIENAALHGGDRALDFVKIDYLDGDHQAAGMHALIATEARSSSLFGGRRVVTVVHADDLQFGETKSKSKKAKAELDKLGDPLEAYVAKLDRTDRNPPSVLILVAEHFDRRLVTWKNLIGAGALVEVAPLTAAALQNYLTAQGNPFSIRVQAGVAQKMWDRLGGTDAARLRSTADRLLLDAGPNGAVSVKMVEDSVPIDREAAVFAVTDAVAAEDVVRVMTVLHLLREQSVRGDNGVAIIAMLASHFQKMMLFSALVERGLSPEEIERGTGIFVWRQGQFARQLRALRPGRLELALRTLAEADMLVKASAASGNWLEQAVLALVHGTPLRPPDRASVLAVL